MIEKLLSLAIRLFGVIDLIGRLVEGYQQRKQGRLEQRSADMQATLIASQKQAEAAAKAPKTRSELEETLGKGEL